MVVLSLLTHQIYLLGPSINQASYKKGWRPCRLKIVYEKQQEFRTTKNLDICIIRPLFSSTFFEKKILELLLTSFYSSSLYKNELFRLKLCAITIELLSIFNLNYLFCTCVVIFKFISSLYISKCSLFTVPII